MLFPILHRVLVKPKEVETTTAGGIVLAIDPKKERTAVEQGEIIAIGETAFKEFKAEVFPKIGERVYYAKFAGKFIKDIDDTEYLILNDEDILAIIK
jgi:chaperonin GroES